MLIPKSFRIGRKKYKVERHPNSLRLRGTITPEGKRIILFNAVRGVTRTPEAVAATFWHEATHAILQDMGTPLYRSESFVDAFSKRLHQLVQTADLGE